MGKLYTADFETTTDIEDCRVWAFALCEIGNPDNFIYGNSIDEFMKICKSRDENKKIWFHNLKFDGTFIFYWLLSHGYTCIKDKSERKDKTFTTLISDMGRFYSIEVYFDVTKNITNKVTFMDSLNIFNFGVEQVAISFDLPIRKLKLDYHQKREVGHILTDEEISYIKNDAEIMARALDIMFKEGYTKMTIGSDALADFKEKVNFKNYFPVLEKSVDEFIRNSYKGGWVYVNPIYKEKIIKKGIVIDKNSMYPSQMYNKDMPFGDPIFFNGEYKSDILYPLFVQQLSCTFEIKKNMLPTIQIKNYISSFNPQEYLTSSNGELVTLTLTSVDLELFFKHYDVSDITYHGGFKFKKIKGLFCNYIDYWMNEKNKAKKEGNSAMYLISKLFLNSLYGKFGLNPNVRGKYPTLENDIVKYHFYPIEERDSIYVPLASFITSYARYDIIENAQAIRNYTLEKYGEDYFIYTDTDSIHTKYLTEEELSKIIELDDYKLGAYKVENVFRRGLFIRQKCYIEEDEKGNISTTIAGLPKKMGKYINFNNFKKGFSILASDKEKIHKLRFKNVKGGVVLVDTDFTIK